MTQRPLSPVLLIAAARPFVGLGRGPVAVHAPLVDHIRYVSDLPVDAPWDLAFIHHVGWHSQRLGTGSSWPFARDLGHDALAREVVARGLNVAWPMAGDIVLYWNPAVRRYAGSGIVERLHDAAIDDADRMTFRCDTIEVLTLVASVDPALPPGEVTESVRPMEGLICPARGDLVIRWTLADRRQAMVDSREPESRTDAPWAWDALLGRCA